MTENAPESQQPIAPAAASPETPFEELSDAQQAEARVRRVCDAAFDGNLAHVINSVSSEAYVDILRITTGLAEIEMPEGYTVEQVEEGDDSYRFQVTVQTPTKDIVGFATVKRVKGNWIIAAVKLPGIRD